MKAVLLEVEKQLFGKQLGPRTDFGLQVLPGSWAMLSPGPGGSGDGASRGPGPLSMFFQAVKGWSGGGLKLKTDCLLFLKNSLKWPSCQRDAFWGSRLCFPTRHFALHHVIHFLSRRRKPVFILIPFLQSKIKNPALWEGNPLGSVSSAPLPPAPSAPGHLSLLEPRSSLQAPHPANQQQQRAALFHWQPCPRCCPDAGLRMGQGVPYRGDLCPSFNPVSCSACWVRPKLHDTLLCHPLRAW